MLGRPHGWLEDPQDTDSSEKTQRWEAELPPHLVSPGKKFISYKYLEKSQSHFVGGRSWSKETYVHILPRQWTLVGAGRNHLSRVFIFVIPGKAIHSMSFQLTSPFYTTPYFKTFGLLACFFCMVLLASPEIFDLAGWFRSRIHSFLYLGELLFSHFLPSSPVSPSALVSLSYLEKNVKNSKMFSEYISK